MIIKKFQLILDVLQILSKQSSTFKRLVLSSICVSFFLFLVEMLFAGSMQFFLVNIKVLNSHHPFHNYIPSGPWWGFMAFISIGLLRSLALALKVYFQQLVSVVFTVDARIKISDRAIENANVLNISDVLSTYSDLVQRSGAFIQGALSLVFNAVIGFCYLLACFYYSASASLLSIALVIGLLVPLLLIGKGISSLSEKISFIWKKANQSLMDALRNHLFIRIHGLANEEKKLVGSYSIEYQKLFYSFAKVYAVRSSYTPFIGIFVLGLIGVLSYEYRIGVESLSIISFFYIFIRFSQSCSDLMNGLSECQVNYDAMKLLNVWVTPEATPTVLPAPSHPRPEKFFSVDKIEASQLCFSFSDVAILSNVSFQLLKGDRFYIHGESGSGKSTLISLVLGILKPTSGHLRINGTDISHIGDSIFGVVSYSGPQPLLKVGSLRENLLYGNPDSSIPDSEILEVLEKLAVTKINPNMKNLDFMIDDNVGFSTGQKQRISIARALLMKPKLLIFDEATSNLDKINEDLVLNHISHLSGEMITIFVSHRDSIKKYCNKELKLESLR